MLHIGKLLFGLALSQDIDSRESLIPLSHDAEGFVPLYISESQLKERYHVYLHDIPKYLQRLKQVFNCEMQEAKTVRGIHMPDWVVWAFPSVKHTRTGLVLYMGSHTLEKPMRIGKLDLIKSGLTVIDGILRIRDFLDKYIDYDDLKISSYQVPLKKKKYNTNWTELDDLILQMLMQSANYQLVQDGDQDETVRLIGEFFRWRGIVLEFCQQNLSQVDDITLPEVFEKFLVRKHKMPPAEAKKYKYLLDLRRQHLGLIVPNPNNNTEVMTEIFQNFTLYGLTMGQEQADRYRDQLFPAE